MKSALTSRNILRFLAVLFLLLPYLSFAEEPKPTQPDPAPPSSSPTLRLCSGQALGGKEGGRDAMEFKAGEIIVRFRKGISQASIQSLLLSEDVNILNEMDDLGFVLASVPEGRELEKIEELKRHPLVEYAEPNYVVQAATIPAESLYRLRALDVEPNDPYYEVQWNLARIGAPAAWDITTGSDRVVIAVIDTGVDLGHPELKDKIWTNTDEIPDNGTDDDRNGYVDDVHGWDFVNWDNEPQDDYGLGTYVATVAAAETNNGFEVAEGSLWGTEILPIVTDGTSVLLETSLVNLDGVTGTKNAPNGIATATLISQVPGVARITAMADSKFATSAIEFQPGPPYTVTLAAYPTTLTVGNTSSLTATAKDEYNNNVADGTVVSFETSLGSLGSTLITKTTVSGVATAELSSQVAGTASVTATADSKYDTINVIFNPDSPYALTLMAYPTILTVGETSSLTATVKDQYDNNIADGTVVSFETSLGSLGSTVITKSTVSGVATAELSSQVAGTASVTAMADSKYDMANVTFNPGLPHMVIVEAYPTSIPIGGFTSEITATVMDQYDNPVADGTEVTFATDLGNLGLGSSSVVKTTTDGVATATLTSGSTIGTANISATSGSAVGQTQVTFAWGGGIAGVSWGAEIMPIKVLDSRGVGFIADVNGGIKYAVDNGARILILDFLTFDYIYTLEAFIDYAHEKSVLLVAPVGDCAQGCKGLINPVIYPAALPQVLAVAATSQNDEHYFISGYKPYVDVAAPGERIPGFWFRDGEFFYATYSSTAFAVPHVAGLAALIWSVNPTLTNDQVESIIESTAVDLGEPGKDDYFGYGRIGASAAVRATPHYLEVEPHDDLHFLVCDDGNSPSQKITNPNTNSSTWTAESTAPWLSISPPEGYTPSSATVSVDKGGLADHGVYTAAITATSTMTSCTNCPQTISVTAIYTQCRKIYLPLLFKEPS